VIRAVLFDLDGTLLDSTRLLLDGYRYAVRKCLNVETRDEDWLPLMGKPLPEQMAFFSAEKAPELVRTYREFYARHHEKRIRPFPGVLELLAELKSRGLLLAAVTSKKSFFAERGLEAVGLRRYFSVVIGEDDTQEHKPGPAPVLEALRRLRVPPECAVMVGDSPYDIAAAKAAGVRSIAVLWGPFSREDLERESPDAFAGSVEELFRILNDWVSSEGNDACKK
jgi:pyrophosphatase PpaX